ncbi:MAG TPA: RNA polymerase sigma-70 factor [Pedobacter sp.]|uniref:RNA polymerase sigma-70 factor n=1 Tax=Pedobacter sp. TaxID=1411316 RepID=UPI002BA5B9D3|nr:RNA polymerase sigma-70 factor [Pedobacter sp.]HMI03279.1 RNA polymerase sigma-70 factor [Pedobacter sp.]
MAEGAIELKELFKVISLGDKKAFDSLFNNYYVLFIKFATSYLKQEEDADEVVSELFVRLWLKRTELDKIVNPKVYLYVSVKNACLNFIRNTSKNKFNALDEGLDAQQAASICYSPETIMEDKQLQAKLDQAVSALPEQRKLIFTMVKVDGLKCREVAEILNLSVRTVEGQVFKAVKTLADELTGYLGYNPATVAKHKLNVNLFYFLF